MELHKATDILEWGRTEMGLIVPVDSAPKPLPKAFDFFAGAGGFSCGLHQGGFHVIGAMEFDRFAAWTYMTNLGAHPMKIYFDTDERRDCFEKMLEKSMKSGSLERSGSGWISNHDSPGCEHFWLADIRNITGEMILEKLGMKRGELDLVVGGPPCQGFSSAGKREVGDPRNNLVFEYARMIVELNPKTFVMENVPGILTMTTPDGVPIMDQFCRIIADGDYAPYESVCKMMGLKPTARKGMRRECKKEDMEPQRAKKKPLASAAKVSPQPMQQSMF